jgi:hypothetical protein
MKILEYYPYRTALVRGNVKELPRELMKPVEEQLCKMQGVPIDNHTCYLLEFNSPNGPKIVAIRFHDFVCKIGDCIERVK